MTIYERIKKLREAKGMSQYELAKKVGYEGRSAISKVENGQRDISQSMIEEYARALDVTPMYLMYGEDVNSKRYRISDKLKVATFPIIGEVAAGYNHFIGEDWTGETVEIPISYLRGASETDFFVLSVKGDSMYPLYHDGDKVLIKKQNLLDYSGQIAVVRYDDDKSTLKKIEYTIGSSVFRMVPINPQFKPIEIFGEEINRCGIIGIPKLLLRDI